MKHISRIKEVSELFHLPASALRYWDDEGLIRFERSKDNHYRCLTSQTMLDICDVIFYRSLSLSIKEIKSIPGMCVEDVDHTLETNARRLEDQIRQMQMTLEKLQTRRSMVQRIMDLERTSFQVLRDLLPAMKLFSPEDRESLETYVQDPYQSSILIKPQQGQEIEYGIFLACPDYDLGNSVILRDQDAESRLYLKGLLKVNAQSPDCNNAGAFLEAAQSMGYGSGQLTGRYLLTACDGYRCDYYEAWLEIWDNG